MSFRIVGGSALDGLANLQWQFRRGLLAGGRRATEIMRQRATQGMQGGHSGIHWQTSFRTRGTGGGRQVFPVGPPGLPRQSSAPGEYAASQSGRMLGSLYTRNTIFRMEIGFTAPHAAYVEYGTDRMGARPTLGNTVRDTLPQVRQVLGQTVWQYIRA